MGLFLPIGYGFRQEVFPPLDKSLEYLSAMRPNMNAMWMRLGRLLGSGVHLGHFRTCIEEFPVILCKAPPWFLGIATFISVKSIHPVHV